MLGLSLSSCHRYHPAEVGRPYQSAFDRPCRLRPPVVREASRLESSAQGSAGRRARIRPPHGTRELRRTGLAHGSPDRVVRGLGRSRVRGRRGRGREGRQGAWGKDPGPAREDGGAKGRAGYGGSWADARTAAVRRCTDCRRASRPGSRPPPLSTWTSRRPAGHWRGSRRPPGGSCSGKSRGTGSWCCRPARWPIRP